MDAIYRPEDREVCETLLAAQWEASREAGELHGLIVAVGRSFLGAPYQAGTLEGDGPETLVVNLRTFDCVTFVENVVVLASLICAGRTDFSDYLLTLEGIRYRGAKCDGYASRLHYFTDWIYHNERKGILRDVTRQIGGVPFPKALHRLTDHRAGLSHLSDRAVFRRMRIIEGIASKRVLHHIPKEAMDKAQGQIEEGDIIAITTHEEGLDVRHVGIALRRREQIHLLHASSLAGRVVQSEEPLEHYLMAHPGRPGIIVGRLAGWINSAPRPAERYIKG